MRQEINMETWERKEHFEYYSKISTPHFCVAFNVDITNLLQFTRNVIYLRKILPFRQNFPFSTSNSNFYINFIKKQLTKYRKCAAAFVSDVF